VGVLVGPDGEGLVGLFLLPQDGKRAKETRSMAVKTVEKNKEILFMVSSPLITGHFKANGLKVRNRPKADFSLEAFYPWGLD